ncbi:MAG: magnesium-translocating P-type ATPase [Clostridia bacterium]|nr:magnesium-translocating P-type ATPase [Clostridia bacterium]
MDIEKMYGKYSISSADEVLNNLGTSKNGLSQEQAEKNIKDFGINKITHNKQKRWYNYFFASLFSPFNSILLGITLVLIYTDILIPDTPNYSNIVVIIVLVLISTLLEFFEEFRSNKAAEKLKELVEVKSTVKRDNIKVSISVKQITIGDIVMLSAGDMIPSDLRIIESTDFYVSQSALTGESDAIKKQVNCSTTEFESIPDLDNICFMGTNVISGSALGVVIKIADNTYLGKIASTITSGKPKTAFQKGIESISKLLIKFMLVLIPLVFLLNAWKHNILLAFTFAVAIAIGITPLLLPVILSSSLSKGAIRMSKKKTIVKKLDSIQSFGSMNILCTDKTGTLTEDKIVLEKYLNINGEEDERILKSVFLNSYFQTGLKGNIDEAIIARGITHGLEEYANKFTKIDEVPFDFSRRRLSIAVTDGTNKQFITKGAIEEILSICTMADLNGSVSPITNAIKQNIRNLSKGLNKDGLRVLAVCQKKEVEDKTDFDINDEKDMVLLGFVGFLDPPKESAKIAIERLNNSGIRVIVLTGDNADITRCICNKVGINTEKIVLGSQIDKLQDLGVKRLLRKYNVFAKLSPIQKSRIIRLLKEMDNIVGYMGDGINDSPSLINSDVGISVDTAVDIAKESADIILLEKDLNVLLDGVTEGRRTFANLMKYIKMAISFNFGEVSSVIIASVLLPFFPITPIQLLVQSLLYDFGQLTLPFDNVDKEYLESPSNWKLSDLKHFMLFMGPLSSCFDLIVFASIWFIFGIREAAIFQTIWFVYGVVSNLLGMHVIRTAKLPFVQSNASKLVYTSSLGLSLVAILIPFTFIGEFIGLTQISLKYLSIIIGVPLLYCIIALFVKKVYIKKYGNWI